VQRLCGGCAPCAATAYYKSTEENEMKLGFTGTQIGMTPRQADAFRQFIESKGVTEFHHGDCIGADAQAHSIARVRHIPVIVHPPSDPKKRAYVEFGALSIIACGSDPFSMYVRPEKPYIERNHDIVDETDELVATPKSVYEELRSGTWATIRYAQKLGKPVTLIMPDGTVMT